MKKLLESYEGKLSCTVLIGEKGSDLLDYVSKQQRTHKEHDYKDEPWDNALIEDFYAIIKRE